jgi:hypothetical protein
MINHKCLTLLGPATYLTFFFSMRKTKSQTFYHRKRERAQTTIFFFLIGKIRSFIAKECSVHKA